jgi:hypothetical protein
LLGRRIVTYAGARLSSFQMGARMGTLAVSIQVPPAGELETSGKGSSPTQTQMDEETAARDGFLKTISPFLDSLPGRPPHHSGNVSAFDLLGSKVFSTLNHYLLLLTVDVADGRVTDELSKLLPAGSKVSILGEFESVRKSGGSSRP